jgi:outer membrane protein TolC
MKKLLLGLLMSTFFFSASVMAQESVPLSLQAALDAALKNNKEVVMAGLDEESARARYKQTDAVFLPQINLSYSAMSSNNPLNAFGFKLQQQSITQADFDPVLLNNPSATQNFMTKAEWKQPILNTDMLYMRKAANQQTDVYAFKTKRVKEYLAFEVEKAYAQLRLAHQAKAVVEEAVATMNSIYTSTKNRFEKGYLQKSDLLQVQVQVTSTENKLAEANSNVQNASDYLSLLMGTNTGVAYSVEAIVEINSSDSIDVIVPEKRADFQAMQSAIASQDIMISSSKMSLLPKLNAFAEYMINDKEAFGFGSNAYLVGAQLSWTLFNGMSTQHKTAERRIERDKMMTQLSYQKEQSQLELNKTLRQLQDAKFSEQQQMLAVKQAAEALTIIQNRYQQGLVTTNDLLQAQTLLSQQKLYQAQAGFQVHTTHAYLQFLTSTSEK